MLRISTVDRISLSWRTERGGRDYFWLFFFTSFVKNFEGNGEIQFLGRFFEQKEEEVDVQMDEMINCR